MSESSAGQPPTPDPQSTPPAYPGGHPAPPQPPQHAPQPGYAPPGYPQYAQTGYPQYAPPGHRAYGVPGGDPDRRPTTVTVAAVTTWVCTALTVLAGALLLIATVAGGDTFLDDFIDATDSSLTRADARAILVVSAVVLIVWAGSAAVLAVLAFRRQNWARITLVVSAGVAMPVELVAVAAVVPGLLLLATIAVVVLLFTGGANAWYRGTTPAPAPVY